MLRCKNVSTLKGHDWSQINDICMHADIDNIVKSLSKRFALWTGDKWRAHRKLIAPTFHLNVLKSFVTLFNVNSRDTVNKLRKMGSSTFDVHDFMSECTVEILLGKPNVFETICNYTSLWFYIAIHDVLSMNCFNLLLLFFIATETAMGVSKKTQKKSGFEYAAAVMK